MITELYRYELVNKDNEFKLRLDAYKVLNETNKTYKLELNSDSYKLVRKESKRKFANLNKEEALQSFIERKKSQYKILMNQINLLSELLKKFNVELPTINEKTYNIRID